MEGDVDKQRKQILQGQMSEAAIQKQHQRNYNRWLSLYQTGVDLCGRTVMVIVGRNIPVTLIDIEKALLYFIHVMDHITVKEYVMVYFHTLTGEHNHLDPHFLKNLFDIVDTKSFIKPFFNLSEHIPDVCSLFYMRRIYTAVVFDSGSIFRILRE
uniref:Ganglioside-induced differentiation-associated protein 2-like n=1 Tax=Labrus bergylta TaxID=56723 RepID=A0A3Q3L452_9LABR